MLAASRWLDADIFDCIVYEVLYVEYRPLACLAEHTKHPTIPYHTQPPGENNKLQQEQALTAVFILPSGPYFYPNPYNTESNPPNETNPVNVQQGR